MSKTTSSRPRRPLPTPKPPRDTSTFAPAAAAVSITFDLPHGFLSIPDSDGSAVLEVTESRLAALFGSRAAIPSDANRLWIVDEAERAFPNLAPSQIASIRQNGAAVRSFLQGQVDPWLAYRIDYRDALGNGNYATAGILPNAMAFKGYRAASTRAPEAKATSLADIAVIVAGWTTENYPRKPIIGQPFAYFQTQG